jgi:hypothetical protein
LNVLCIAGYLIEHRKQYPSWWKIHCKLETWRSNSFIFWCFQLLPCIVLLCVIVFVRNKDGIVLAVKVSLFPCIWSMFWWFQCVIRYSLKSLPPMLSCTRHAEELIIWFFFLSFSSLIICDISLAYKFLSWFRIDGFTNDYITVSG